MTRPRVAWLLALAACSTPSARDADCAKVRAVVDRAIDGVPRRHRDAALRERAHAQLVQIEYADDGIRRVALDEAFTVDAIENACAPTMTDREHDCAAVRTQLEAMHYALLPDLQRGGGLRDESGLRELAQRTYLDPAVKQAVTNVVRETGIAFYASGDHADRAARDAYARLATLCAVPALP